MIIILSLNIQSDSEYGCWVFITTWFGTFHYFTSNSIDQELKKIAEATNYRGNNFKENFIKTLELEDIIRKFNCMEG